MGLAVPGYNITVMSVMAVLKYYQVYHHYYVGVKLFFFSFLLLSGIADDFSLTKNVNFFHYKNENFELAVESVFPPEKENEEVLKQVENHES